MEISYAFNDKKGDLLLAKLSQLPFTLKCVARIDFDKIIEGKTLFDNIEIILNIKVISIITYIRDLSQIFFLTHISNFDSYPFLYLFLIILLSN